MANRRPTQRARILLGAAAAATLVSAAVWILGPGASPVGPTPSIPSTPKKAPTESASRAALAGTSLERPIGEHTPPVTAVVDTDDGSGGQDPKDETWLPNPDEDFGAEDAYFEARYGAPTPQLIRASLSRALLDRFPERRWTAEEQQRAGDALIRIRQLRLAMRGIPFTPENAAERRGLLEEYKANVDVLENELEIDLLDLTASGDPERATGFGGGLDNAPRDPSSPFLDPARAETP